MLQRFLLLIVFLGSHSSTFSQSLEALIEERQETKNVQRKAELSETAARLLMQQNDTLAIQYANEAVAYASKVKERKVEQASKLFLADVLLQFQRYDASIWVLEDILEKYGASSDSMLIAQAYLRKGKLLQKTSNYSGSIESLKQAMTFGKKNPEIEAAALNTLGVSNRYIGNHQEALKFYLLALDISKRENDSALWAESLNNIGVLYKNEKKYYKALEYYQQSLAIREALMDSVGIAKLYNNLGVIHKNFRAFDKAMGYYQQAMGIWRSIGDQRNLSFTLNNIGVIFLDQGQNERALQFFEESREIKSLIDDRLGTVITSLNIGEAHFNEGDFQEAEDNWLRALNIAKQIGARGLEAEVYEMLSNLHIRKGNHQAAVNYLQAFIAISDSLRADESARSIEEVQSQFRYQQSLYADSLKLIEERRIRDFQFKEKEWQLATTRKFTIVFFVISILIGLLAIAIYSRFKAIKRREQTIAEKNEELKRTLISKEEKEVLLKEIHHRVKNNLQIISSLLRLQSSTVVDEGLLALYQEMQDRILSMSLVHMQLYRSDNFSTIEVPPYFDTLVDKLIASYQYNKKISVVKKIEVEQLGIDHMIPVGLIINELVTNSLKHAFTGLPSGKIEINFYQDSEETYHLQVIDDGMGLGGSDQLEDYDSMGLDLIRTLVLQLEGKIKFINRNGLRVDISFTEERGQV